MWVGGSVCVYDSPIETTSQKELANAQGVPVFISMYTEITGRCSKLRALQNLLLSILLPGGIRI